MKAHNLIRIYISYTGEAGVQHLGQEIANNIIDEHINPNSISDGTASIYYDAQENIISFQKKVELIFIM